MKRLLLVIALLLFAVPVFAQDVTNFAWDYADSDSLFLIDEGGGFKLYASKQEAGPFEEVLVIADPTARTCALPTAALRGRWYFTMRAYIPTNESVNSNIVSAPFKPETPGNFRRQ